MARYSWNLWNHRTIVWDVPKNFVQWHNMRKIAAKAHFWIKRTIRFTHGWWPSSFFDKTLLYTSNLPDFAPFDFFFVSKNGTTAERMPFWFYGRNTNLIDVISINITKSCLCTKFVPILTTFGGWIKKNNNFVLKYFVLHILKYLQANGKHIMQ